MATEEITISELELADEVLADMTLPVDTATETRAVTLKQLRAWLGSALPVGSVFASVGRLDDERFTLLDGKTISRIGTYEAFCNKVVEKVQAGTWKACTEEEFNLEVSETGQCGKFVVSNDYVRIPKLGNSLCSGVVNGTIPVVGNGMTLGLTNGTDDYGFGLQREDINVPLGSVNFTDAGTPVSSTFSGRNTAAGVYGITTDPTKSGIEGKINSVEVFYYMVISTEGQTENVEIDINKVYEDMNLKANSDLSNVASVASSFKEASVGWGVPDYSAGISVAYPVQAKPFVAPSDGVYITTIVVNNTTAILYINGVATGYSQRNANSYRDASSLYIPLSKGDSIYWSVARPTCADTSMFYPFKGVN